MPAKQLLLYSRSYCHLCEDMLTSLQSSFAPHEYAIEVKDVDSDPEALQLYDELVPVLLAKQEDGSWLQLCHYFLDKDKLAAYLRDA